MSKNLHANTENEREVNLCAQKAGTEMWDATSIRTGTNLGETGACEFLRKQILGLLVFVIVQRELPLSEFTFFIVVDLLASLSRTSFVNRIFRSQYTYPYPYRATLIHGKPAAA